MSSTQSRPTIPHRAASRGIVLTTPLHVFEFAFGSTHRPPSTLETSICAKSRSILPVEPVPESWVRSETVTDTTSPTEDNGKTPDDPEDTDNDKHEETPGPEGKLGGKEGETVGDCAIGGLEVARSRIRVPPGSKANVHQ